MQSRVAAQPPPPAAALRSLDDETQTDIDRSTFTLKDLVDWGIKHPSEATDALIHLIAEMRQVRRRAGIAAAPLHPPPPRPCRSRSSPCSSLWTR